MDDLFLARTSLAAYYGSRRLYKLGYTKVESFFDKETDTEAYVCWKDDATVVVFRGTESDIKDIATDLKFRKKDWKGVRIHRGFLKAYLSVINDINCAVNRSPKGNKLYATGHSLAGALSQIYCSFNNGVNKLTTFGQPPAGNKAFKSLTDNMDYRRYVYCSDIVARIPLLNYWHGGEEYFISRCGKLMVSPPAYKKCLYSLPPRPITDHSLKRYIRKIHNI